MTLPLEARFCPKCKEQLTETEDGRECNCGLRLPPYPLTWPGRGRTGPQSKAPEEARLVGVALAQRVGLKEAARALGLGISTLHGWLKVHPTQNPGSNGQSAAVSEGNHSDGHDELVLPLMSGYELVVVVKETRIRKVGAPEGKEAECGA